MPTPTRTRPAARKASKSPAKDFSTVTDPIAKLNIVEEHVAKSVIGREKLIRGIVLSLVAGQNILALGVPGTAKTMLVQRIAEAFATDSDVFDILLTKFTKASEVFGPTDIAALENGQYRVNTDGYLADAKVGIIDECFKGSSAILNALLRIANERTFRNGSTVEKSPVRMLVGMSNEFPEDPALLAAFFDRFPSKFMVGYLDTDQFEDMIGLAWQSKNRTMPVKLTEADFAEIDRRVAAVNLPAEMVSVISEIRVDLKRKSVEISDRRWVQAVKLMAANAVYHGRDTITRRDLEVLESVAWNSQADQPIISGILPNYLNPFEKELRAIVDDCYAAREAVLKAANYDGKDSTRPTPDIAKAASEAAHAIHAVKGAKGRLEVVRDLIEDASDEDLLDQAVDSIDAVDKAVMLICKGKNGIEALADTMKTDL